MYMSGKLLVTRKPVKGILCGKVYSLVQKGENFARRHHHKSERHHHHNNNYKTYHHNKT